MYQPTQQPYMPGAYSYQPQIPQMTQQPSFSCRPVTSREEAQAAQIDFFSPGSIMPDLGHGVIYLKRFNQNTGGSDLFTFSLQQEQPKAEQAFAPADEVKELRKMVEELRVEINRLKGASNE